GNDDGQDDRVDRGLAPLADLGQAYRQHAVEGQGEDDAGHDRYESKVDRQLRRGHREPDEDLGDRIAGQDQTVAQSTRIGLEAGDGAVVGRFAGAHLRLRLHEVEVDRVEHEHPDADPDHDQERDADHGRPDLGTDWTLQLTAHVVGVQDAVVVQDHKGHDENRCADFDAE